MRRVYVIGHGLTKVEEHWDKGLEYLMTRAAIDAISESGVPGIDLIYVGNMCGEVFQYQSQLGAVIAEELGLSGIPSIRVEAADASGAVAINQAFKDIASGVAEAALVVGGEKLSDASAEEVAAALASTDRYDYTGYQGSTLASIAALLYKLYLGRYGLRHEDVATFSVIMHEHASTAPHAQYPFKISLESVLRSPIVSDPLRRLECTSIADGAAAVVMCSEELLKKLNCPEAVEMASCVIATDYVTPLDREDALHLNALATAVDRALGMARVSRDDINLMDIHDSYSIMAALSLESAGFSPPGKSCHRAREGDYSLGGKLPVNTFGGLKARGHPLGATGVYQVAETYLQLLGEAGKNQVEDARIGMTQSLGGLGATAVVTVMRSS